MKTAKNVLFNLVLIGVTFVLLMTLIASFKGCERFEEDPPDRYFGETYNDPKDHYERDTTDIPDTIIDRRR